MIEKIFDFLRSCLHSTAGVTEKHLLDETLLTPIRDYVEDSVTEDITGEYPIFMWVKFELEKRRR